MSTSNEVTQILDFQVKKQVSTVSPTASQEPGFVTVKHNLEILQRMNGTAPSIIAKEDDLVVGYALVMPRAFAVDIPVLQRMLDWLDMLSCRGKGQRARGKGQRGQRARGKGQGAKGKGQRAKGKGAKGKGQRGCLRNVSDDEVGMPEGL